MQARRTARRRRLTCALEFQAHDRRQYFVRAFTSSATRSQGALVARIRTMAQDRPEYAPSPSITGLHFDRHRSPFTPNSPMWLVCGADSATGSRRQTCSDYGSSHVPDPARSFRYDPLPDHGKALVERMPHSAGVRALWGKPAREAWQIRLCVIIWCQPPPRFMSGVRQYCPCEPPSRHTTACHSP
jgi:hypothetical protein